jgi:hypothetical protein
MWCYKLIGYVLAMYSLAFAVTASRDLYKIFPKEAPGLVCPIRPVCLCGSLTMACQLNKPCFVDCIHA